MGNKITQKITSYRVKDSQMVDVQTEIKNLEKMHEDFLRPDVISGKTYKIKTPNTEHAVYVTINDVILNEGTDDEEIRPFEIFITSKDTSHHQWVSALTRVMSAVLRKGGEVIFLVEELKSIFDPKGGYLQKGQFIPSLMADIGIVLEKHMQNIGMIKKEELAENVNRFLRRKD